MLLWCDLGIRSDDNDSSSENSINGDIPLKNVTRDTSDIDFGFYYRFWFKDNNDLSPSESG